MTITYQEFRTYPDVVTLRRTDEIFYFRDGVKIRSNLANLGKGVRNFTTPSTVTSSITLTTQEFVLVDASAGDVTVTLPDAVGNNGRRVAITRKDSSNNAVTIDTQLLQTVQRAASLTLVVDETLSLISDNTDWWLFG